MQKCRPSVLAYLGVIVLVEEAVADVLEDLDLLRVGGGPVVVGLRRLLLPALVLQRGPPKSCRKNAAKTVKWTLSKKGERHKAQGERGKSAGKRRRVEERRKP